MKRSEEFIEISHQLTDISIALRELDKRLCARQVYTGFALTAQTSVAQLKDRLDSEIGKSVVQGL